MLKRGRHARRRAAWRPGRWEGTAIVLLLVAAGGLMVGLRGYRHPLAGPAYSPLATPGPPASPVLANPTVPRSAPVSLRIPAIGVAVSLSQLGLNADGTVQVPTDFARPGWFRLGPSPGQIGSAVILGHVDSYRGPAVFFRLRSLHPGDHVEVSLANGMSATFVVSTVASYPKDQFPSNAVYGSHGYRALQLVTCGGTFDTRTRSYLSNVVVYTSLLSTTATPTATTGRGARS